MSDGQGVVGERSDLLLRLRGETAQSHRRLEQGLDLLTPPLKRERFLRVLERFYGFHAVWEPAVSRFFEPVLFEPRRRLDLLAADLRELGRKADPHTLPRCAEAAALADTLGHAFGSLYVMEGSTLGGQVISRELAVTDWAPHGLRYFNPYGRATGAMWTLFKSVLSANSGAADSEIVAGALSTFGLLHDWLTPTFRDPG